MARLSKPIEVLIGENAVDGVIATVDAVIVGSGYGGSFAAARFAGPGREVLILERGREYAPGDFPADLDQAPRHMRFSRPGGSAPIGYADALFDLHLGEDLDVLVGSGVGGTSLINANVAIQPEAAVFEHREWPPAIRKAAAEGELTAHFEAAAELLGVSTYTQGAKHEAFKRLAGELGAPCKPAPIAITTRAGLNKVGIQQAACTGCGNCVSGCNVGAKNTLAMNVLPLAQARGAAIYSGATVLSVQPEAGHPTHPWSVRLRRTLAEKTPHEDETFVIRARKVVLAAGTLGSTEILLRSRPRLALSGRLGSRFSGNGDALAFSFGQDKAVEALGQRNFLRPDVAVGPTITAIASPRRRDGFTTMEDGAVPHAMLRAFEEIITTAAQLNRLVDADLPAWHRNNPGSDPLTLTEGAQRSAQVLLLMGDDGGNGNLELRESASHPGRSRVEVCWKGAGKNRLFERGNDWLAREDRGDGFDGGQFVPNPLWQAIPKKAADALSGGAPGGRVLTVHPLGGCPMGENVSQGVVDHLGRVFDPAGKGAGAVHEGLYVLDGSIIPRALGINPFLTIAALAMRAAEHAAGGWEASGTTRVEPKKSGMYPVPARVPGPRVPVHFALRERLIGTVQTTPQWLRELHPDPKKVDRWLDDKGLILDLRMDVRDLEQWLRKGPSVPFDVVGHETRLYSNALPPEVTRGTHAWHTPAEHLPPENIVATADGGTIKLLAVDERLPLSRTLEAIRTYWKRRVSAFSLADLLSPGKVAGFWSIARMHATYRVLEYSIDFTSVKDSRKRFRLTGRKVLAWRRYPEESARDGRERPMKRLVDALLELPIRLNRLDGTRLVAEDEVGGEIEVDGKYLAGNGAPQVVARPGGPHPSLPSAIAAVAGFGLFFLRSIFQTNFWEFGAPTYPKQPILPDRGPPPLKVKEGREVKGEVRTFEVPLKANRPAPVPDRAVRPEDFTPASAERITLRLVRYPPEREGAPPALLVHGLAQGSTIFTRDMLDRNMAAYLWDQGYEVWVLDYRLSHLLDAAVPQGGWAMDELGCFDIPEAVRIVHEASRQPVRLFAHCLGATATTMGILTGRIPQGMLHCVAFNAVHPWIMPSAVNEVRAMVGSFFRDVLGSEPLSPVPRPNPAPSEVVLDRLAHAISRYGELDGDEHANDRGLELENAVCDRMSLLYGRMWSHANLDERTHRAFTTLMGPAPGEVYRHLYYFSVRKRLTDREGLNLYLTDKNLERWTVPTIFMHGEDSMVFNPHSATRSAIRLHEIVNSKANQQRRGGVVPIGARRFQAYGHMDVVFAKVAAGAGGSFELLRDFFADPALAARLLPGKDDGESHMRSVDWLTTGPILRAAWVQGGKAFVRFWGEHAEEVTSLVCGLELTSDEAKAVGASIQVAGAESRYHLLDAQVTAASGDVRYNLKGKVGGSGIGMQDVVYNVMHRPPREVDESGYRYRFKDDLAWLRRLRSAAGGASVPGDMRFLVASCRYPGTPFEHERADAVFGGMLAQVNGLAGAQMQFFIGDQIYADATANILDATFWRERYSEQYRAAFTSGNFRKLLRQLPTHFTLDDHEFRDNWSGDPPPRPVPESPRNVRMAEDSTYARKAARSFMTSGRDQAAVGASRGNPFWYPLDHVAELCRPTFLMDSRSERDPRAQGDGTSPRLIGKDQMDALAAWLDANARVEGPKFIVTSTGIGPVPRSYRPEAWRNEDGWLGYPATCAQILGMIASKDVRDVVIVSGDLHLSAASRISVTLGNRAVTVWELVSSGLYAPMPFANAQPDDFDWHTRQPLKLHPSVAPAMAADIESCLLYQGDPHFMRVDVTLVDGRSCLDLAILDADGAPVEHGPNVPSWLTRRAPGRWKLGLSSCPVAPAAQPSAGGVRATR